MIFTNFILQFQKTFEKGNYSKHMWIKGALKHFKVTIKNSEITRFVKEYWDYIAENSSPYDEVMEVLHT